VVRLVVSDFMSLDGVVQAPGGPDEDTDGGFRHGGWSMPFFDVDAMGSAIDALLQSTDALLFGRRTWQSMAAAWPARAGDPFADRMNALPKYVVSRTLTADDMVWNNSTLLPAGDIVASLADLRERPDGCLQVMGSPNLVQQLVSSDLVDEYRLMVNPILLGGGKRIFPDDGAARALELIDVGIAATGVLICTYRPAR
jgi:dihydrofolate reductase